MRSAFENVVDNALRYGDCADIEVHHERDSEGREWLYIDFRDNGPGIPEEKLEFVLEPYVRLETSRNRKTGGHGLGSVSYTHLDVYKRQGAGRGASAGRGKRKRITLPALR